MKQASDLDFLGTSRAIGLPTPLANDEAANKLYVDTFAATAFKMKGVIDCSTNPNYPAAVIGDVWKISVAGLIGGALGLPVTLGDTLYCTAVTAAGDQAAVGANWNIIQYNDTTATTTVEGNIALATQAEVLAGVVTNKAVTPQTLAGKSFSASFGDGIATSFAIAHGLGSKDLTVTVREVSTDELVNCDIAFASVNQVNVSGFTFVPTASQYRITVKL